MVHAARGFLIPGAAAPGRTHDLSRVGTIPPDLTAGDVRVGDRAFGALAHRARRAARKVRGVFRVHPKQSVDFRPPRRAASARARKRGAKGRPTSRGRQRLGRHDHLVAYGKPKQAPAGRSAEEEAALPPTIPVRERRYTIRIPGRRTRVMTRATTLLDPVKYPAAEVADRSGQRGPIATNFRHLQQTLGMAVRRGQPVEGVQKELTR